MQSYSRPAAGSVDSTGNAMSDVKARSWSDVDAGHPTGKKPVPEGLWVRCPDCSAILFRRSLENNLNICPECEYHFRVSAGVRITQLADPGTFVAMDSNLVSCDPLGFVDVKAYPDRIVAARKKTGHNDAIQCGTAFIKGRKVILAIMEALEEDLPLIIVSASGGARMMESGLSLMQMAKTSAALARFDEMGGLFISVLADPTTGGVTASFAMLGDVILAERGALIGFAGPRVIEQTIRQELPEGFQRAEFLLDCGFVDRVVHRKDLRSEVSSIIDYAGK
jgi:acetyl-CoA carboxylase carboxyl transferase subunit beta